MSQPGGAGSGGPPPDRPDPLDLPAPPDPPGLSGRPDPRVELAGTAGPPDRPHSSEQSDPPGLPAPPDRRVELAGAVGSIVEGLEALNEARETALVACRQVIRAAGSSIRAVHRLDAAGAALIASESEAALRTAQQTLAPYPAIVHAGFLHDAEKEYVEARAVAALVAGVPVPGPDELDVSPTAWMRGLAEAASELRRHLLDRLREGAVERAEALLAAMDDVYGALVVVDYPDAVTSGLRRTLDALRAVLERSRGDVTTTVLQTRLQRAIDRAYPDPS